jgi:hypothetical protein
MVEEVCVLLTVDRQLATKEKCLLTEESRAASDRSLAGSTFLSKKKAHSKQISGKPGSQYTKRIISITDVAYIFQVSVHK